MDADLVARAQRGDERAFANIVEAIGHRWLGVAQRILYDPRLAEDATQQALVKLWRHLPGLRDPARFEAWSYRLLVKACYSEGGRRRRWLADVSLRRFDQPTASDDVATVLDRDELERGLRRISVDHRTVLVLRYYLDLPLDQVAAALDVPFGTVSSRLNRAHEALRGVLEADARTSPHPSPSEATR
jgi:RNA polymerase sigma-70 factor (ECF subfamily)